MFIFNSIAPLFLLIALGWTLQKTGFLPDHFFKGINRLVFWFALPALLISRISVAELELATLSRIVLLLTSGTLLAMTLAWIVSRRLQLPAPQTGSFIQGSFRGNGAFIGLPVIVYSLGSLDPRAEVLGIPLIVVRDDTYTVARKMEAILSRCKLRDAAKIEHGAGLITSLLDFDHLREQINQS